MLSDEDLARLENAINTSTLNDLPQLLTRFIPALFAELRITRDAMRAQADDFFANIHSPNNHPAGMASTDSAGLQVGPEHPGMSGEVPAVRSESGEVHADSGEAHTPPKKARKRSTRRRRDTQASGGSEEPVDASSAEQEVGRALREAACTDEQRPEPLLEMEPIDARA